MRTVAWIFLVISIAVVLWTTFTIKEAKVGPRVGKLLALALIFFAVYSPAALFDDLAVLPLLVSDITSQWPLLLFLAAMVVAFLWFMVDLIRHRKDEIVGLKDSGSRFLVIGIFAVIGRLCAGYLF